MISETKRALTGQIKLTRAQYEFLRTRYNRNRNVGATWLVRMAMLEIVSIQAQAELDKSGYGVKAAEGETK